ncbi:MAG: hypothetical protein O3C57_07130, partial [Verrucomicrobia bacterium]|nr:hypothetical protein [Verrucomicrobiota bacterium]
HTGGLAASCLRLENPLKWDRLYFEFSPGTSDESAQVVEDAVRLSQAGYAMDAKEISERTGYQLREL